MKNERLLGTSAAARALEVSENVVRRKANEGALPCTRDTSGKRLFTAKAIAEFKAQWKPTPVSIARSK